VLAGLGGKKLKFPGAEGRDYEKDVSRILAAYRFEVDGLDTLRPFTAQAKKTAQGTPIYERRSF
jgi:hypothetical protein